MNKKANFKKNIFLLILSLAVGIIHIYPDLKFIHELGNGFKGITFNATHDSSIYLGRINNIYKGYSKTMPSIDLYEHRNDPWTVPFLGELLLGAIGSGLHIPLNYFKIICSFFLPIINFWLIFCLVFLLAGSETAAILSASAVTMGYSFFANSPLYIYDLIFNRNAAIQLWFLRPVSPQFNYVLLFTAWIFIYLFMTRRSYLYAVLSGISVGLFLYIGGPYYFTYFIVFIMFYALFIFWKREFPQLVKISVMFITIILIAIPFTINYFKLVSLPEYKYLMERLAFIYGRRPIIPAGITLLSVFLIWFHYSRKTKEASFVILFLLAGFACLNQQLITGRTSQPSHWQNYMVKTFVLVVFFPAAASFLREKKMLFSKGKLIRNIGVIIFMPLAILQQENYYQRFKDKFSAMQELVGPFSWLKNNTHSSDVVLNDPMNFIDGEMPFQQDFMVYTNNYPYLPASISTLVSIEEVEHRYLSALSFFNYSPVEAERFFTYWNGIFFRGMIAEDSFGGTKIPDSYLLHLKNKYIDFLKENPLYLIEKYKIDYIILDKSNLLYGKIDYIYKQLIKVYDDGQFKIYKMPISKDRNA